MSNSNKNNLNNTNTAPRTEGKKMAKILTIVLVLTLLSAVFQVSIFAQEPTNIIESGTADPVIENRAAPVTQYTITYYSNYPAGLGLSDTSYQDPIKYENEAPGYASTLAQTGFALPTNYYFAGWHPSPSAGTAQYLEGAGLGKIDVDWHLYAIYRPYRTMEWKIAGSSYNSTYNAQSHTDLIEWPVAQSAAYAGDVIAGLTYQYSVNGGAFSDAKPSLVDAGNYTVTVKATADIYTEITTTVNVVINKAPLTISPDTLSSYKYGSISKIGYNLPAVNTENGPKSQADESALNAAISATNPLFDAIDNNNNVAADLSTALPGNYTVKINSGALAALKNNSAFRNYDLSATEGGFAITALDTLTVDAKALNTIYNSEYHGAVSDATSSVTNAKIEYSLNGSAFTAAIPQVKNAGSYTVEIRASAPGYNDVTIELTAIIEKRDVTLNIAQYSKQVGSSDPKFNASVIGIQGSDNLVYTLDRISGEAVGDYTITASVATNVAVNNNYNVKVNNGLLTITAVSTGPVNPSEPTEPSTTEPPTTETPDLPETTTPEVETPEEAETPEIEDEEVFEQADVVLADEQPSEEEGTQQTSVNIDDANLPLSTNNSNGTWALLNLILAIITVFVSVILIIGYFLIKKEENDEYNEYDEENQKVNRKTFFRFGSAVVALVSVIAFILTQNILLEMVFVDRWTVLMFVLAIVQIAFSVFAKNNKTDRVSVNESI